MQGAIRLKNRDDRFFLKAVGVSLLIHVIIISIGAVMFRRGARDIYISPAYTVNLVGPASAGPGSPAVKSNDIDGAPEKTKASFAAKTASKAIKKTRTEKNAEKAALKKDTATVENAIKRIERKIGGKDAGKRADAVSTRDGLDKRIESIKKDILSRTNNRAGGVNASGSTGPQTSARGNAGLSRASIESNYPAYYSAINERVQSNWAFPEGRDARALSVIVSIRIKRDGQLLDAWVEKTSGNTLFDESLLNAVKKTSPFPALPDGFPDNFLETGLRFCPGCAR
ncbi:MAG: cell envelope integrity protein TolA [Deltaproteobacteria bacterium]|mgnify:CR=1 FL=1